ncbi:MAG: sulfatase [Verrucomicrobia bacterium]|nr:sulfatase [Verrucomicrobiota bacterium]
MRLVFFLLALASAALAAERPLNVLFITADDMNADSPGWMGNPLKLTPNLDAFAGTAHQFVNNHVSAPICQPSRSAFMSGRVPHRNGALGFEPMREGTPSLVTVLRGAGYFAAGINKLPHMMPETSFPWDAKFMGSGKNPELIGRHTRDSIAAAKRAGKPFFINCNITDPHRPFYGSEQGAARKQKKAAKKNADSDTEVGEDVEGILEPVKPAEVHLPNFLEEIPDVRREIAQYYSSIKRLDLSVAQIMKALADSGEAARTIVIFMSDHGMSFPFSKATVYFNGTRSPVLLRWPGMGAPQRREEFVSSVDLMPTLLEVLKVPAPAGLDGRSWLPLLRGEKQPGRDHVFTNVNSVSSGIYFPQRCVRNATRALMFHAWASPTASFKVEAMNGLSYAAMAEAAKTDPRIKGRVDQLIHGNVLAFYDLTKDGSERRNEIDNPAFAAEIATMKQQLLGYMERTQDPQLENYRKALAGQPLNFKMERLNRKKGG